MRATRSGRIAFALAGGVALLLAAGCSPGEKTNFTVQDLQEIAGDVSKQLQADVGTGELAKRTKQSPEWRIAIVKVTNLTSDMLSEGMKRVLVEKVRESIDAKTLAEKNIKFLASAETIRAMQADGSAEPESFKDRDPTHNMTATFRSITRTAGKEGRTDAYFCDYEIMNLKSGQIEWTGRVEIKRMARGRMWD